MLKRDWHTNAAIVGGVIGVFLLAMAVTATAVSSYRQQHQSERADAANPQQGTAAQNAKLYCASRREKDQVGCAKEYVEAQQANSRADYDLRAQQEMSEWAFGMFFISGFGLLFSAFGLAALVWTFREQRKLTIAQQRAVLQIEGGALWPIMRHSTECLHVEVAIRNTGQSHAKGIMVTGRITYSPDIGEDGQAESEPAEIPFITGLDNVPPGEIDILYSLLPLNFSINEMLDRRFGSGGPNIGTAEMQTASITFGGVIRYKDDLGTNDVTTFSFTVYSLESGVPTQLEGWQKHWRAQAYTDMKIEREEQVRQRAIAEFERRKK